MLYFLMALGILITSSATRAADNCGHTNEVFKCVKYLRNYDADTVTFDIPGIHPLFGDKISVRVRGIDTPEKKGRLPCEKDTARNAQRLVENLLKNAKTIELHGLGRDKYFRVLADVRYDGKDLKDVLLKNNLAYPYFGGTKQKRNWCGRVAGGK